MEEEPSVSRWIYFRHHDAPYRFKYSLDAKAVAIQKMGWTEFYQSLDREMNIGHSPSRDVLDVVRDLIAGFNRKDPSPS